MKSKIVLSCFSVLFFAASAFSQGADAQVPVIVNVNATVKIAPITGVSGTGAEGTVTAATQKIFNIKLATGTTPSAPSSSSKAASGSSIAAASSSSIAAASSSSIAAASSSSRAAASSSSIAAASSSSEAPGVLPSSSATDGLGGGSSSSSDEISYLPPARVNAGAWFSFSRGNVALNLQPAYRNAVISLHSISGKQVLRSNVSDGFSMSRSDIPPGVYILSVKGAGRNFLSAKLTVSSGNLNINAAFSGGDNFSLSSLNPLAKAGDYGRWTITVEAEGYHTQVRTITPDAGLNSVETFTLERPAATAKANFTETVGNQSFDMVYVPSGTFTIGCEAASGCPADAKAVSGVTVSNYYLAKTEVTAGLWLAVMGEGTCSNNSYGYPQCSSPYTSVNWYEAMEFACKLSEMTGRNYRMSTEAEWEYAAKNHLSKFEKMGNASEEWAYNSWSGTHSGGTDPVGPASGIYTQKTRRDAKGYGSGDDAAITGRLIRSVEGEGPALRLAISADTDYPPGMVAPCYLHMPEMGEEPVNSYRDMRWVTGGDARWTTPSGAVAAGNFDLRVWEDGTASMASLVGSTRISGQWFTSNNIAFVFVPNSDTKDYMRRPDTIPRKYAYIFLDETHGSLISGADFMTGGFVGRIEKASAASIDKPTVTGGLKSGEALAKAQPGFDTLYKMVDMTKISEMPMGGGKKKDPRLLEGTDRGWFQDNTSAGGVHHYRKDVDLDEFRFTVNQGSAVMLANGDWFTLNETFLRVTHKDGYTVDYLYAVQGTGDSATFQHNSFMAYERGDFRMFRKKLNSSSFPGSCGSHCNQEIPKNGAVSMYNRMDNGQSTFKPAPCPPGGCN